MERWTLQDSRGIRLEVEVVLTPMERMRGLLGRERLEPHEGLLIPNARSVHTVGMRFPIDVAFLDRTLTVIAVRRMPPWRFARPRLRARHVLECNVGEGPQPGDRLIASSSMLTRSIPAPWFR